MAKSFKTISEQIELLKERGLDIPDENTAYAFLLNNNYYRVSGYSLTLRNHDVFNKTATFQNIIDIYSFDEKLRALLLYAIQRIEVKVKSVYAYYFTQKHGALGYLDSSHFTNKDEYDKIIAKSEQQKVNRKSHEPFLQHFIEELNENIPLWAYIDLFTISDISKFYTISENDIQKAVAAQFGFNHKNATDIMRKYLHCMTILRNLCAHGSRIYNRLFITKPSLNKKELSYLREDDNGNPDNSRAFGYILNIRRLLSEQEFAEFKSELFTLCDKFPFVDMRYYGFSENWQDIL